MGERIGKLFDWAQRLWWLWVSIIVPAGIYFKTNLPNRPTHEIAFILAGICWFCLCSLLVGRDLFMWGKERRVRRAVVEFLSQMKGPRTTTIQLTLVATAWHGKQPDRNNLIDYNLFLAKFRRLKDAMARGEFRGQNLPNMQSTGNIDDLIRYFNRWLD